MYDRNTERLLVIGNEVRALTWLASVTNLESLEVGKGALQTETLFVPCYSRSATNTTHN